MKTMLKEPLLVFLLLGTALFVLFQQVAEQPTEQAEITVSAGRLQALTLAFKKTWQRQPDQTELKALIDNYIRDEVYYREALAMGLDKDDTIIKRRLRQKMEFISEDIARLDPATEQELQAFLSAHPETYRLDSRFSFQQIYINSNQRGATAQADALALLAKLKIAELDISQLGDSLMVKQSFSNETEREIKRILGSQFLLGLQTMPIGSWQAPIKSGFGLHLVRIENYIAGAVPELKQVRDLVVRDWEVEKRKRTNEEFYNSMRENYKVSVKKTAL
ncbi:MAG: peptidyl-prolyl cis-trans isomerase [Methyloprofundus sp.]|nr:peptidyl-prolyl cis-trans isomerase [Methyloprofundus sp.]